MPWQLPQRLGPALSPRVPSPDRLATQRPRNHSSNRSSVRGAEARKNGTSVLPKVPSMSQQAITNRKHRKKMPSTVLSIVTIWLLSTFCLGFTMKPFKASIYNDGKYRTLNPVYFGHSVPVLPLVGPLTSGHQDPSAPSSRSASPSSSHYRFDCVPVGRNAGPTHPKRFHAWIIS